MKKTIYISIILSVALVISIVVNIVLIKRNNTLSANTDDTTEVFIENPIVMVDIEMFGPDKQKWLKEGMGLNYPKKIYSWFEGDWIRVSSLGNAPKTISFAKINWFGVKSPEYDNFLKKLNKEKLKIIFGADFELENSKETADYLEGEIVFNLHWTSPYLFGSQEYNEWQNGFANFWKQTGEELFEEYEKITYYGGLETPVKYKIGKNELLLGNDIFIRKQ